MPTKDHSAVTSSSRFSIQLIVLVLLVDLIAIFSTWGTIEQNRKQHELRAEQTTRNLAHVLEEHLTGDIAKIDVSMLAISDEMLRQLSKGKIDRGEFNSFIAKREQRLPEVDSLRAADEHGIIKYGLGIPSGAKIDVSDRPYFNYLREHDDGRLFVSAPIFARINQKWVLPIARRLNHPDKTFAGVVIALISLDSLHEAFSHLDIGKNGIVNLRDSTMNTIARYPTPQDIGSIIGKNTYTPELSAALDIDKTAGTYRVHAVIDNIERTYSYHKLSDLPLYVTVGFASDDYLAEWRDFSLKVMALTSVFILITSLAAWLIYQGERRRLKAMRALHELNQDFITLLESTTDFIYFKDQDSRIRFCSQTLANITGHKSWREMIGKHDVEIFPEDTARIYSEEEIPIFRDGTPILNRIDPYYDTQGNQGWVSTNKWPVFDTETKKVVGIFGISRDVSEEKRAEIALLESKSRLSAIINNEPECIKIVDAAGTLLQMNPAGLEMIEASSIDQVAGRPVFNVIAPKDRAAFLAMHKRVIAGEHAELEFEVVGLKGGRRWLETHAVPMQDHGKTVHLAVTRDITERKRAEEKLHLAASVFTNSREGILITDADRSIIDVNDAFSRITGYSREESLGKNPRFLSSGRQNKEYYEMMWRELTEKGHWYGEIWNRRKNGEVYAEMQTISAVYDSSGKLKQYVALFSDITSRKTAEDEIKNLAFYDPLTGLPNRRLLTDRLKRALASSARSGRQGALLFIDLDNFKTLNDTLGHDVGDLLLQQVALRLVASVREGDTVARMGGDEFIVMLEDLSEQDIEAASRTEAVGNKILSSLQQPYHLANHEHTNTPSIGATLFSNHHNGLEELFKQADIAMYQAKKAGRNRLRFFDPEMQRSINLRASLEGELNKALELQQFELHFQPQVDRSNRILGAEALIRWSSPTRGLIAPDEFIPLIEDSGLILPVGAWVLRSACQQIKQWQSDPLTRELTLAVNVSAKQFRQPDFVLQVMRTLHESGADASRLKLELTESMLVENIKDTIESMRALKEIGVQFALDDFGTGYSSLQYLKKLPLDQLKIDKTFVNDIAFNSSDSAIVRTIIAMAESLNLDVIAEGVETEEQRHILLSNGCNHYQGYLFSKPLPIEGFEQLLRST